MAMTLQLTNAGRAALINNEGSGTAATRIISMGITATAFTFDPTMTALPDETKRITTIGGTVHDGTLISMAMRDESADSYTMRAFGLYLEDGTLLAAYSQADPVVEKHPQTYVLLQLDLAVLDADVDLSRLSFGNVEFVNPHASETVIGVARLATTPEAESMADNTTIMTPLKTAQAIARYTATEDKAGIARIATADEAAAGMLANAFITPATLLKERQALGWRLGEVVTDTSSGIMWINTLPWNTTHPSEANAQGWQRAIRLMMRRVLYPSSTTWYKTEGLLYLMPEAQGAGGGGGQVQAVAGNACIGGGGGSGAYASSLLVAADIPDSVPITVGAAGPSGSGGGASSFGNLVAASGGGGGAGGAIGTSGGASGGIGGSATAGQLRIPGRRGGVGWWPNASIGVSGYGAESNLGAGGHPRILGLNIYQSGDNASGYGAGGSGAAVSGAGPTFATGGLGAPGLVIVTEYIVLC